MSDATPRSIASRRSFIRQGAAAAVALPAVVATLAACGETKAAPPLLRRSPPGSRTSAVASRKGRRDGRHAREGRSRRSRPRPRARATSCSQPRMEKRREGLRAHRRGDPVGGRARPEGRRRGPTTARCPARRSASREGDRVRVILTNKLAGVHRDPLPRPRAAERPGRRAVHHPAAGQAGRELHLRVHRAQRRLAHVPLAPQRGEAGRPRAARRVHRRAEASRAGARRSTSTT